MERYQVVKAIRELLDEEDGTSKYYTRLVNRAVRAFSDRLDEAVEGGHVGLLAQYLEEYQV